MRKSIWVNGKTIQPSLFFESWCVSTRLTALWLGPNPPDAMPMITQQTFAAVLSTCGYSVAMFGDVGGISKREA